jgi:hypothetical protein
MATQAIGKTHQAVHITNSGTAPLLITAVNLSSTVDFTANPGRAPSPWRRQNCQINVTFSQARRPEQDRTLTSSATPSTPVVPVTGTSK